MLNSPLLSRRLGRGRFGAAATPVNNETEISSDDDITDPTTAHNYQDLESFQKAQMLNKVCFGRLLLFKKIIARHRK